MRQPVRSLLRAWRAKRRFDRGNIDQDMQAMLGDMSMPYINEDDDDYTVKGHAMNPIIKSKTTATVAGATATSGGLLFGAVTFIRSSYPDLLPWQPEGDAALVAFCSTILVPLISRFVAVVRKG